MFVNFEILSSFKFVYFKMVTIVKLLRINFEICNCRRLLIWVILFDYGDLSILLLFFGHKLFTI